MSLKLDDVIKEWAEEIRLTEEVMKILTDESLKQAVASERRTLGQLAWHLVTSIHFLTYCGLTFDGPAGDKLAPESATVIAEEYQKIGSSMLHALKTQWSDETLNETQEIMGEKWKNDATLRFSIMHQAHHRGQMTVLIRQAGLFPPELYGPTYETWINKGVAPLV
jgi:uncharacterized damage-inducible protein DinB